MTVRKYVTIICLFVVCAALESWRNQNGILGLRRLGEFELRQHSAHWTRADSQSSILYTGHSPRYSGKTLTPPSRSQILSTRSITAITPILICAFTTLALLFCTYNGGYPFTVRYIFNLNNVTKNLVSLEVISYIFKL